MIKEYLQYLREVRNLSDNTIIAYGKDLKNFTAWALPQGLTWRTLTKTDVDNYNAYLGTIDKAPTTRCRRVSAIRNLLRWAKHEGLLQDNVAQFCQSPKIGETLPRAIDLHILENYLKSPAQTERAKTIHALVALILDTGCRLQESIDIRITDVNTDEQSIIIHGKGRKERKVYYTARTMYHCSLVGGKRPGYLIDNDNQWELRTMMAKELPGLNPHAIRHTMATTMLNKGASLDVISLLLGHSSRKTTERYARLSVATTQEQYKLYHA